LQKTQHSSRPLKNQKTDPNLGGQTVNSSRVICFVEHAAMRLGEMNLARGRPVTACVYLNWILDHAEDNMGLVAAVSRLLEGKEVCQ